MGRDAPVLHIEGLCKSFRSVRALDGIDITLDGPGVYGFLGPNGAGKSTTFRITSALLRPDAGTVRICGADLTRNRTDALLRLGAQFDASSFYPFLTGRENLEVCAKWLPDEVPRARYDELLARVGLESAAGRKAGGYSWGMRQRLGLAGALLNDPVLVLLDEPTNGLDPAGIADVRRLLPQLARDEGRTVFLSSHRMEEVERVCDHVTIIHEGKIVAAGVPDTLGGDGESLEQVFFRLTGTAQEVGHGQG